KVRVMLHDYAPGRPFKTSKYREPQFDDLSRARVLHIFRDSGGHEAPTEAPFDFSWEPSPVLGGGGGAATGGMIRPASCIRANPGLDRGRCRYLPPLPS